MSFLEIVLENRGKGGKRKPFKKSLHTKKSIYQMTEQLMGKKKK